MDESILILDRAAKYYGFSPDQAIPLSGGHFSIVYEILRHGEPYILRITPPNAEVDFSAMSAILNWMNFLAENSASIPIPVPSMQGNLVESLELDKGRYILVAFEKTRGILAEELFPGHWSDELTSALGHAVGRMHAISRSYQPQDSHLWRPDWDEIGNCFNPTDEFDEHHSLVASKRRETKLVIQSLPKSNASYGLIHTDLHFANFLVEPSTREVTIIDFDDCSYGWYVMDIAMLLLDLNVLYPSTERETYTREFLRHFLLSYLQHNSLDLDWIRLLPAFLKLLEMGLYAMLYRNYDPRDSQSWIGRFMMGRRECIENDIPFINLDFSSLPDEIDFKV